MSIRGHHQSARRSLLVLNSREGQSLFSWLTSVIDYNYFVPRYRVDRALESHGLYLAGSETQLTVQRITEQTSEMSLSQLPQSMPTGDEWQQPVVSEPGPAAYGPAKNQDDNPLLLLGDDPPAPPTEWAIPQGPDSGYKSWEHKPQPDPVQGLTRSANAIEVHHHNPTTTSTLAAGTRLLAVDVGSDSMLDDIFNGIGVERFIGPYELDNDAVRQYPRNVLNP